MSTPVSFVDEFGYRWEFSAPVDPGADMFGLGPGAPEQVRQDRQPSPEHEPFGTSSKNSPSTTGGAPAGDKPRRFYLSPDHGRHVKAGIANSKRLAAMRGVAWRRHVSGLDAGARAMGTERSAQVRHDSAVIFALDVMPHLDDIVGETTSLRQIAQALNDRDVVTPRGRRWHPETVRRLQARLDVVLAEPDHSTANDEWINQLLDLDPAILQLASKSQAEATT